MDRCFLESIPPQVSASGYTLGTVYLYFKYCNLKCRHCWINPPYTDVVDFKEGEIPIPDLISSLEECRKIGMRSIKITGGEPFTRKDIFTLLDYLKENKLSITMETNATLIREKEARALKEAGVWHIGVSLDGPNAEIHESLRGVPGAFNAALEGIKCLIAEKLNVQVIIALWQGNKEYIKDIIVLAKTLGANSVKINPINGVSRADRMVENQETLSVKETIAFYHQLKQELKDRSPAINVIFDIPAVFQPMVNRRFANLSTCGIFNILGILGDGRISICGIGSSAETLVLGKLGRDNLREIWEEHPILKEIRQGVPKDMQGICGNCLLKHYCLGKCRAEAYYENGSLLAPLSFCQIAYEEGLFPESRIIA